MKPIYLILTTTLLLLASCEKKETAETTPADQRSDAPVATAKTPEDSVRTFFLAMLDNDREGLDAIMIPNPRAEILISEEQAPPEAIEQMKQQFSTLTLRDLQPGDTIRFPDGQERVITDQDVGEEQKWVIVSIGGEPMPLPLSLEKIEGQWKVDAGPIIAARLASQAMREQQMEGQPPQEP